MPRTRQPRSTASPGRERRAPRSEGGAGRGGHRTADPEASIAIRSLALGVSSGHRIDGHAHPWSQLIYAIAGVMTVETSEGSWVVPAQRALWVPGGVEHEIEAAGAVSMRTLYLRPDISPPALTRCRVVHVSPLLRELVLHVVSLGYLDEDVPPHARLVAVIVDQLTEIRQVPLELSLPSDPRARRVADRVRAEPASHAPLAELARGAGASPRTLERLFQTETGMSFGRWRQQVRLLHALRRLADGASVTTAALDVGYDSTSAFIAMFKRALGTTPGKYYTGDSAGVV